MKTKPIISVIILLILLFTVCVSGIQAIVIQQPPFGKVIVPIAKVKSDTAKVEDSLAWYAGPLPVFESREKYNDYLARQKNVIRDLPIRSFDQLDKISIKNEDNPNSAHFDFSRTFYHQKVSIDSIPLALKDKIKKCEFYNLMQNAPDSLNEIKPLVFKPICRLTGINYYLPVDINLLLKAYSNQQFSVNDKIEIFISTYNGFKTNYKILSIAQNNNEIYGAKMNFEIVFIADKVKYSAYLKLRESHFDIIYIQKENDNKFKTIGFNK